MENFEYAQPRTEAEAVALLSEPNQTAVVLAGGCDLVGLMKRMVVTPDRVVNIAEIEPLQRIDRDPGGQLWIGAAVRLDAFHVDPQTDGLAAVKRVIQNISSVQLRSQGTLVGELLRRPACWYFRGGHGLLADDGALVVDGDNRYHAILGNRGPAKFVNASRLAPALIALGAQVRVIGPQEDAEQIFELEQLFQTPRTESQLENVLTEGQLVTHVIVPPQHERLSAAYEVRHGEGPDPPLAAAAVSMDVRQGQVQDAKIVLGQVAPTPWLAANAAHGLEGKFITEAAAATAGIEAVAGALALSHNEYKIQLAQVAVQRAILQAAGLETGGLDAPLPTESAEQPDAGELA